MPDPATARMAVLIDADNTSASHASAILEELARYGIPTVKRAYGDWTTQHLVRLEGRAPPARDPAGAAVRLHDREELHGLRADHRRDGPALLRQPRRLRDRLQRLRLHPARYPDPGVREDRLRPGPTPYAGVVGRRLRPVHLPRGARAGRRGPRPGSRLHRRATAARPAADPHLGRARRPRRTTAGRRSGPWATTSTTRTRRSTRATTASPSSVRWPAPRTTSTWCRPTARRRGCACGRRRPRRR